MKKFLSLVLALIMTMSLVTISAGATEYRDLTDKEEIQYAEAVAVLNRIGVITGYEDGSFRPETELTRGAAAKIIVSLMIGPDAASALPNNASPYPDVPAGHTFAGVIGYCKTAGYISGYGDGTFKPANPLTGYAFAKMLLGAVGYKSSIEGFVDTGWTMNVARIGNVAGLFDRLDFDGAAAVTRDEACQLALNTLKATMVDYGGSNTVVSSTGEVLTVQGSKAQYVTSNNRDINANINRRVISAQNNELTLEFGEEHFKDLRLEHDKYDPAYDVYGHPSNEWSYKKVTIGTFKLPADFTYTDQIVHREATNASKEKALGLRGYDTWSIDHRNNWSSWSTASSGIDNFASPFDDETQIHINGWNARVTDTGAIIDWDAGARNGARTRPTGGITLAEIADLTDNGVTVEVYVCPVDADFITDVVVMRTQLMEIDRVASDYVRLKDIEPDSRDKSLSAITGYNAFAIDCTDDGLYSGRAIEDVKDDNYDAYKVLKDMKAGDKVAVIPYTEDDGDSWEVGEAYAPETVSGTLTRVDIYNSETWREGNAIAITVGGTSYKINEWNEGMIDIKSNDIKATRKDVTLYLAKDGTALQVKDVGNAGEWMIVGDYYQATNDAGKVVWYVHGWTTSGTEVDLDLGTIRGAAEKYAPGELVRCQINTNNGGGEYVLTKPNNLGYSVTTEGMYSTTTSAKTIDTGYTHAWNVAGKASNTYNTEAARASGSDAAKNWEGIYRVALGYGNNDGVAYDYSIKKSSQYILLDGYGRGEDGHPTTQLSEPERATIGTTANDLVGYKWNYQDVDYDSGVKFVYVSFDSIGEVESIYFADGKQNVDNEEMRAHNTWWRNVGTNIDYYVATTAEAYVNDKGNVATVVIKTDSADADLSGIRVITKNTGSNNYVKSVGADATETELLKGKWTEREYVQGPDFKEIKTGIFDKEYNVGDILIGSERNGIFYARAFHGDTYRGNSLDGLWIKGVKKDTNTLGETLKDRFLINDASVTTLKTLDKGTTLTASNEAINDLLNENSDENADEIVGSRHQAGVILGGSAKVVDARVGHEGEITKLKDLFDYDLSKVELKVLLNGKKSDAGFRSAYVIVILDAPAKKTTETEPVVAVDITSDGDGDYKAGSTTAYKAFVGEKVTLNAIVSNLDKMNSGLSYKWVIDNSGKLTGATTDEAVFDAKKEGTYKITLTVTNPKNKNDADGVKTVELTIEVVKPNAAGAKIHFSDALAAELGNDFSIGSQRAILDSSYNLDWAFTVKAPDYLKANACDDITFDATVTVGADVEELEDVAMTSGDGTAARFTEGASPIASVEWDPDGEIDIEITKLVYEYRGIEWTVDGTKLTTADLGASGKYNNTTTKLSTLADADVKFQYATTDTDASHKVTVTAASGFTPSVTGATSKELTATEVNAGSPVALNGKASAWDYVKINVTGVKDLTKAYTVSACDATAEGHNSHTAIGDVLSTVLKMDGVWTEVTGTTTDALTLTVVGGTTVTAGADGKATVTINATISAAAADDVFGYTVTIDGQTSPVMTAAAKGPVKVAEVEISDDWMIEKDDITVNIVKKQALKTASVTGTASGTGADMYGTITVTLPNELDQDALKSATISLGTESSSSAVITGGSLKFSTDGKSFSVDFTKELKTGAILTIGAASTNIVDANNPANKSAEFKATLKLDAGAITCTAVA